MTIKEALRLGGAYTWGPIVKHYQIGRYDLIEYREPVYSKNMRTSRLSRTKTSFSIFIDGKSTSLGASSLESAMAHAIAMKYDGINSQAARYFLRGINFSKL